MLVKIITLGLNATVWKNVFHHLRGRLPETPFAAGIFSSPEEISFLTGDYLASGQAEDSVDFLLCDPGSGADWKRRSAFLRRISGASSSGEGMPTSNLPGEDARHRAQLVLTLSTLEHGIKQLIQGPLRVQLLLDGQARFSVTDPALIIPRFPADFPRLRLDDHLTALHLKGKAGTVREVQPLDVPMGTLLGWSELDAIGSKGELLEPLDWLKLTLRAEKIKLPRAEETGLIRERQGLFLCPGLPAGRVTGVVVEGVAFHHLIDLGTLGGASPHFDAVCESVRETGTRHQRRWQDAEARTRNAEAMRDLPVVCGGGAPLVRETFAALLAGKGFARCSTLANPDEGTFREPALLLQIGPWPDGTESTALNAQVEEPMVVPLEADMARITQPLNILWPPAKTSPEEGSAEEAPWQALPWRRMEQGDPPLTPDRFELRAAELSDRRAKAGSGHTLARNRHTLLTQEVAVIATARTRLAQLLEAHGTVQVWSGALPPSARQVLVFSHDSEEAGAVLQALPGIAKKRWFDLAPFSSPDALQNLDLASLRDYGDRGVMVITSASREKLRALDASLAGQDSAAREGLKECESAGAFYEEEERKTSAATETLARQWLVDALGQWLHRNMPALLERLAVLRTRHERRWFSRALVNRVAIIPSSGENRPALLAACGDVFTGFKKDNSRVVHYDYEPQPALSAEDRKALRDSLGTEPPDPETWRAWQDRALGERNRAQLDAYLEVICNELTGFKADLLLIEQRSPVAFTILEHLRKELPSLAEVPAVVILPDLWEPEPDSAMPWPRTRVVSLSRMGALDVKESTRRLRELFGA